MIAEFSSKVELKTKREEFLKNTAPPLSFRAVLLKNVELSILMIEEYAARAPPEK